MTTSKIFATFLITLTYVQCFCGGFFSALADDDKKLYIVYMGSKTGKYSLSHTDHLDILQQATTISTPSESLVRSYGRSFNGFAAQLTEKESERLKRMKGVVSVFPSKTLEIQTTRSWDFLGLPEPDLKQQSVESDIIVGVLDTGIWPESPSFHDNGLTAPPKKWKGICKGGKNFTCNNKLIGARTYFQDARDGDGHGSHTASTAAGRRVDNISFYGIANGATRGGAALARIAVYKVCNTSKCSESDILAAFDDAISDSVDLITISIGGQPTNFYSDVIAIGSFHAMESGILTVQSAGNLGPYFGATGSVAPWVFSVAASSTDRRIITKLILGNGTTIIGTSVNSFTLEKDKYPIVPPMSSDPVKGKIAVTEAWQNASDLLKNGAVGVVSLPPFGRDDAIIVPGPVVMLSNGDYEAFMSYLNSSANPQATILKSETTHDTNAPVVAPFSSRGPNNIAYDILKPDISAPGVDILAAYSPLASVTSENYDKRRVNYSVLSGTSMACPHVAGAVGYLKSLHPDWSPSAIKSALMTTSVPMSPSKNKEGEFAYGAGHLNPVAASNPGLVYETTREDYITLMCKMNYTKQQIRLIVRNKSFSCPKENVDDEKLTPTDVNYPAMVKQIDINYATKPFRVEFHRTVTNVGYANSTYTSKVESMDKIKVIVEPTSLSFTSLKDKKSFVISVTGENLSKGIRFTASLVWSNGIHSVRSPIVLYTDLSPM